MFDSVERSEQKYVCSLAMSAKEQKSQQKSKELYERQSRMDTETIATHAHDTKRLIDRRGKQIDRDLDRQTDRQIKGGSTYRHSA